MMPVSALLLAARCRALKLPMRRTKLTSGIEITTVPLPEHPRLRGAAALVTAPLFAAPKVG